MKYKIDYDFYGGNPKSDPLDFEEKYERTRFGRQNTSSIRPNKKSSPQFTKEQINSKIDKLMKENSIQISEEWELLEESQKKIPKRERINRNIFYSKKRREFENTAIEILTEEENRKIKQQETAKKRQEVTELFTSKIKNSEIPKGDQTLNLRNELIRIGNIIHFKPIINDTDRKLFNELINYIQYDIIEKREELEKSKPIKSNLKEIKNFDEQKLIINNWFESYENFMNLYQKIVEFITTLGGNYNEIIDANYENKNYNKDEAISSLTKKLKEEEKQEDNEDNEDFFM